MTQYLFGTGQLYTMPVGGGAPVKFGALQDISVDFSADVKQLFGQYQFPLDVARGKTKIEGKVASGEVNVDFYNSFYFGQSVDPGQIVQATNEPQTVPAMSTYTITVDHDMDFVMDLGVVGTDGTVFTQVAAMPAAGQYTVSDAGVYTFNMANASDDVLITYLYESATPSTSGSLTITNQLMGITPKFQMVLSSQYNNKQFTMILYTCVAEKMSMPFKQDDYLITDFGFQAQANEAGNIGIITTTG